MRQNAFAGPTGSIQRSSSPPVGFGEGMGNGKGYGGKGNEMGRKGKGKGEGSGDRIEGTVCISFREDRG